jgi:hypothetical protein
LVFRTKAMLATRVCVCVYKNLEKKEILNDLVLCSPFRIHLF